MPKLAICSAFCLAVLATLTVHADEPSPLTVQLGTRHRIKAPTLNETRELWVAAPAKTQKAVVIYVLDGEDHFRHATLAAETLYREERMPACVVVGINNHGLRTRDLGDDAEPFRRFFLKQVVPYIEQHYAVVGPRTLFGHSLAGFFSLSLLADHPEAFDNIITASPVVHFRRGELLQKMPHRLAQPQSGAKNFFTSMASAEQEGARATAALTQLRIMLNEKAPTGWSHSSRDYPALTHMTTPYPSLYQGLNEVFRDYQTPQYQSYADFQKKGGVSGLRSYYAQRGTKYSVDPEPTSSALRSVGLLMLSADQGEQALQLMRSNVEKFPNAMESHNRLGLIHMRLRQGPQALAAYQKAQALAEKQQHPDLAFYRSRVAFLRSRMTE